jgi:23S rRNA (cytidine1920-2'-O)/16S rRNA (cytidine1409-2'-O)-methyltransferase
LLQRGAEKVYAVDTGYGALAWTLRRDERVVVMERTNALYCDVPESVDLVVLDTARTPLKLIVPAGLRWLRPDGAMVALLKPHYELAKMDGRTPRQTLDEPEARQVCLQVCQGLAEVGAAVRALLPSPLLGKGGNREFLLLIAAQGSD